MKLGRCLWVWPLVGVVAAAGCAQFLGFEDEYRLVGDAGAGSSGGGAASNIEILGGPCPQTGVLACAGHAQKSKLICGADGKWGTNGTCDGETLCDSAPGLAQGTCKAALAVCAAKHGGDVVCEGKERLRCGPDLVTTEEVEACPNGCVAGQCGGLCTPESKQCAGNTPQTCDASGAWQDGTTCAEQTGMCIAGTCVLPPSCSGLPATCGASGDELCCASNVVPGGSYNRSSDKSYPATVSSFRLDRFEITVGRFRKFVAAYPSSKPMAGAGAHPLIPGSGWDAAWDTQLPAGQPELMTAIKCSSNPTWTGLPGINDKLPMNCITWYEAVAFCAWDGGRLPTEAEWNYAAAGGSEQRRYPWGAAEPDPAHAVFDCTGDGSSNQDCKFADILKVGSKTPQGDGKWGQADLAGSLWEWNLDFYASPYPMTSCNDCAYTKETPSRVLRGGGWGDDAPNMVSSVRDNSGPTERGFNTGARCARTP